MEAVAGTAKENQTVFQEFVKGDLTQTQTKSITKAFLFS